jgi:hypothetical protein
MRYTLIIFLLSLIPFTGNTQSVFRISDYDLDSNKIKFGIRSEGFNNSSALTATIINKAFYGGQITTAEENNIIARSRDVNNSNSLWNTSLYYVQRIDSLFNKKRNQLTIFANISDRQENIGVFSENALLLALNGNKQFAGNSVQLIPFGFNQIHYNQFQLGFTQKFNSGSFFSIGLSFLYGQNNRTLTSNRFDLITSQFGSRVSADAQFVFQETDPLNANFMSYNGVGTSIDLVGEFDVNLLKDSTNQARFQFSVTDIGFIQWHASSIETRVDTFYSYTGVSIPNVFDPDSPISGDNPGAIYDSVSTVKNTSYSTMIPSTIHFYLQQHWKEWLFTAGGAHRLNAYFHPYFFAKAGYEVYTNWILSGQINYGGYGKLGGGLEIEYNTSSYQFRLGSTNLEGFIAPSSLAGQSIYLLMSYKL